MALVNARQVPDPATLVSLSFQPVIWLLIGVILTRETGVSPLRLWAIPRSAGNQAGQCMFVLRGSANTKPRSACKEPVQGGPADTEDLRSPNFISVHMLQDALRVQ